MDVDAEELVLDSGLPDDVELVGFCQDGWDVEVATNVLKKFLMTMLLKITIVDIAQVEFEVVVDEVVDAKDWSRDVADAKANVHVEVTNDDVNIFTAMHLDVGPLAAESGTLASRGCS